MDQKTKQLAIAFHTRGKNEPFFTLSERIFKRFLKHGVERSKVKMNVEYDVDYQEFVFVFWAEVQND